MRLAEERAAAGAAWLDRVKPGWIDHIDLPHLAMADPCLCVLGQVFDEEGLSAENPRSGYGWAVGEYSLPRWGRDYGFETDHSMGVASADLRAAWSSLIRKRWEANR
jgi:hypothetical protein